MSTPSESRLREHPEQRFAGLIHRVDLKEAAESLRHEPVHPTQGHRQVALYHHGSLTVALFQFNRDGGLEKHVADAAVIIHALEGIISIQTAEGTTTLASGQMLMLPPGVPHDVKATQPALMLLTICLGHPSA